MFRKSCRYLESVTAVCLLAVRLNALRVQDPLPAGFDTFYEKLSPTATNCGQRVHCGRFIEQVKREGVLQWLMDEHVVLLEIITHCCSKRSKGFASDFFHKSKLAERLQANDMKVVYLQGNTTDLFKPLRDFSKKSGSMPVVAVLGEHNPCKVLAADRTGFTNQFVLVGPFGGLAGHLIGGHGIMSGGPYGTCMPSFAQAADQSGKMRVLPHTVTADGTEVLGLDVFVNTRRCRKYGMQGFFDILDDPRLKAWITHQGSFVYRRPGDSWQSHPKVISAPLGEDANRRVSWGSVPFPTQRSKLIYNGKFAHTNIVRDTLHKQAGALFENFSRTPRQIVNLKSNIFKTAFIDRGDSSDESKKMWKAYANAVYALSPPGNGADCWRHYETMLLGTLPIMVRGCGMERTFNWAHAVFVDDLSQLSQGFLEERYNATVEALKQRVMAPDKSDHELFDDYWISLIRGVLAGTKRLPDFDHSHESKILVPTEPFSGNDFHSYLPDDVITHLKQGINDLVFNRTLGTQKYGKIIDDSQIETFKQLKQEADHQPWPDRL